MCGRCCHSVSSITLNTNTVWIIVTGGVGRGWKGFEGPINGIDVVMVVELG